MTLPQIPELWRPILGGEMQQPYWHQLAERLGAAEARQDVVFPERSDWFAALEATGPDAVKVVILGQDPYHGAGQAHGLCFSVQPEVKIPPSLRNIYKELEADVGVFPVHHGYLRHWAEQGVLLLNNVLTVEEGKAASHKGWGWEEFTDAVVTAVAGDLRPKVFILWGGHAQKKADKIAGLQGDGPHLILRAPHPSPLSAHQGFFGTKPFSKANEFLESCGRGGIDWQLPLNPHQF
jgi:uracil-DNA glycosylase